jgi:cytochrome c oxidase assembly protein subunit 15
MKKTDPLVGAWLVLVCVLVYAMILVGGATRLTDSGLSITEWKPFSGAVPPMSQRDWDNLFSAYQTTTQYRELNRGMSMQDFQFLFWWEWSHRLLGRVIGLVVALGVIGFGLAGRLKGRLGPHLVLLAMIGFEGVIGWWMVTSGLFSALEVSPLRLAIHLVTALTILAFALWLAFDAFGWPRQTSRLGAPRWAPGAFMALLLCQIVFGALLAGARGGAAYPDWPTIGGHWIPPTAFELHPFARNFIANHATQQLFHRTTGYLVALTAIVLALSARVSGDGNARLAALAVGAGALLQAALGVGVVMSGAPLDLSLVHQGLAALLWVLSVAMLRASTRAALA